MSNINCNKVLTDIMGNILKIRVICSECQAKYKRVPLITNDLGFKMCKHITHTQNTDGSNVWRQNI